MEHCEGHAASCVCHVAGQGQDGPAQAALHPMAAADARVWSRASCCLRPANASAIMRMHAGRTVVPAWLMHMPVAPPHAAHASVHPARVPRASAPASPPVAGNMHAHTAGPPGSRARSPIRAPAPLPASTRPASRARPTSHPMPPTRAPPASAGAQVICTPDSHAAHSTDERHSHTPSLTPMCSRRPSSASASFPAAPPHILYRRPAPSRAPALAAKFSLNFHPAAPAKRRAAVIALT